MNQNKKVAIGILAFNEEDHIKKVVTELTKFKIKIYVLNDGSKDKTNEIIEELGKDKDLTILNNNKNLGAGLSTLTLLKKAKIDGFQYLLKVDGDDQFEIKDIKKILNLIDEKNFDFIKSNRFWDGGIKGKIPNKRYIGNLFATVLLQLIAGTNKLYDPLNGLFAINVNILEKINKRFYPKRYGYPFYFSALSAISFFRVYQINNVVSYGKESSNLSSVRMLFTLSKLTFHFLFLKIRNKVTIGKYQRSAFLDIVFLFCLFLTILTFIRFILIFTPLTFFNTSFTGSWALILLILSIFTIFVFIESFKEEKSIRKNYIESDE